jgi:hypothetical protein
MTDFGTQIKHGTSRGGSRYDSQSTTRSDVVSINVNYFILAACSIPLAPLLTYRVVVN